MKCYHFAIGGVLAACGNVAAPASHEVTLSQTNSSAITDGIGCRTNTTNYILENSFYRSFALADYGVTGAFKVTKVSFGVGSATSGSTSQTQPADITIYAYTGTVASANLDLSKLVKKGFTSLQIRNTATPTSSPTVLDIPVDAQLAASDDNLVVELHVPDGTAAMNQMLFGVNRQGEMSSAYYRAPGCSHPDPVNLPAAGLGNFALVLSVTGDG